MAIVCFHQADVGEYIRAEDTLVGWQIELIHFFSILFLCHLNSDYNNSLLDQIFKKSRKKTQQGQILEKKTETLKSLISIPFLFLC